MQKQHFKIWSEEEHSTWQLLAERQLAAAKDKLSDIWFEGFEKLEFSTQEISDFNHVNELLTPQTGWNIIESKLEYADGRSWFTSMKNHEFLVTDYLRPIDSLDYTPKPDMFHDAFGHMPFLVNPQLTRIIRKFADMMLTLPPESKTKLGHIWWYSIEFGLIKEKGEVRALGAGLASSFGELQRVFSGQTVLEDFDPTVVGQTRESSSQYHEKLFVHESLDSLESILDNWPLE